ncbi:helicase HerA-like domain-containing protein [Acinetobacter baumannii]|uniref:helicase HerA-like domain-containing protein n=1 Tax=Acinetobacter baumannii TaxID=470 RepID=UPI003D2FAF7C
MQAHPLYFLNVKGDLTGIAESGQSSEKLQARLEKIGAADWRPHAQSGGAMGYFWRKRPPGSRHSFRSPGRCCWLACSISMSSVRGAGYHLPHCRRSRAAAARFKDLRAITQYIGDNAKSFQNQYGNISSASVGAIQRGLLSLEQQAQHTFRRTDAGYQRLDAR